MQKELKDKWVTALRSGDYEQAIGGLKVYEDDRLGHCCLGVLCDIVDKDGWYEPYKSTGPIFGFRYKDKAAGGFLPVSLTLESELDYDTQHSLAKLNDDGGSFQTIADYIEENL